MRTALWLVLAALVASPSSPSSADAPGVDVQTLVDMVRQRPVTFAERQPLIGANFSGNAVRLSPMRPEPLTPGTLVKNFDAWRVAAGLQLLLDYASWHLSQERPRTYDGPDAEQARQLDHESDLRIATLVREAGYEQAWKPFRAVYAELLREVTGKALAYRRETGDENPVNMMTAIEMDKLARPKLEQALARFPMDPQIVAHEMLRLLALTRKMLGAPNLELPEDYLFHACGEGKHARVVVNPGHPLASAFSTAFQARADDPVASTIKRSYGELLSAYRSWSAEHPSAPLNEQLDHVRELTKKLQLVEEIAIYRSVPGIPAGGANR